jgi:hypothetical protein
MALIDGSWLKQFVEPQLLEEFRNFEDGFIKTLKAPNAAAIDTDGIKFNKLINTVPFHVNKTDAFTPVIVPSKKNLVTWDKLDTGLTVVTDAEMRAMAYDKEAELRRLHTESFRIGLRDYAMQKLAPTADGIGTPVLRTTGADDGTGRKRLTYADLIKYLGVVEGLNLIDQSQLYMILCTEHRQDLILDKASTNNYRDITINPTTGVVEKLYKMKFFENNQNVQYLGNSTLKGQGAVALATDRNASIFYYAPNTVHHVESVNTLLKPMSQSTREADPQTEFRLHCYGLTDKKQEYGFGALISGIV